jgi:hypothetical protein
MREYDLRSIIMREYKYTNENNEANDRLETYSYQGIKVVIITVFKTGSTNHIAIVEDVNTGEQFEVFRDQLY